MKPNMTKDLPLPTQVVPTPTSQRMSGLDRAAGSSFLGSSWELLGAPSISGIQSEAINAEDNAEEIQHPGAKEGDI